MNVFVDTSALYAVLDGNDSRHAEAAARWTELLQGGDDLFTTNYVLVETVALAQARMGMDAVNTLYSDLLPLIRTIWVDEAIHRSAVHAHLVSARRRLSLVDCVSFETMRRANLREVFSFDPHFEEQGFGRRPAAT
jgi:predicted nucleic acid-binding protein